MKTILVITFCLLIPLLLIPTYAQFNTYTHYSAKTANHLGHLNDNCPEPRSKDYLQNWSCGKWEKIGGEYRRVFRLYVNEFSQVDVGAPNGERFQGWTFNGSIPAPTLRMTEGDKVTIYVFNSENSTRNHSLHMHSIHNSTFDGAGHHDIVKHNIPPGVRGQYIFTAQPAGVYPYHCHINPIQDHINRGLYGVMIIDPIGGRSPANEMVMMMNGYDFNYEAEGQVAIEMPENNSITTEEEVDEPVDEEEESEDEEENEADNDEASEDAEQEESEVEEEERDNEIYTVNGKAFLYTMDNMINITRGEPQRIYLVNMLEFDLVNSFHLHAGMFKFIPSGTLFSEQNGAIFTDIVTLSQGDRGIIEWTPQYEGTFMVHAHVNEFADLGWMTELNVQKPGDNGSKPQVTPISYLR